METVLKIEGLRKYFGGVKAVDGINLSARKKQLTLLIGPNGSGKTTTINSVTGLYKPTAGTVVFKDKEITGWPMHRVYEVGLVRSFQLALPFHGLSVLEILLVAGKDNPGESLFFGLVRHRWLKREKEILDKAFHVIDALDLNDCWNAPMTTLSTGHLKLVEIGRALMANAEMVILDEPICGVNPTLADTVFSYISRSREDFNLTFLIVEHRLDIALKYADYVYVLDQGQVISEGSVDHVVNDPHVREVYLGW